MPSLGSYFLTVNTTRAPFSDPRVRRALSLAVDRETLTERLLRTGVRPAWSFVPPDFDGYAGGLKQAGDGAPLAERQALARKLLAQAGFGTGKPLTVPLLFDTQEENRKIMVAVAAMWQAIGVKTEMANLDFGALTTRIRAMNYDLARWTYAGDSPCWRRSDANVCRSECGEKWPGSPAALSTRLNVCVTS